MSRTTFSGGRRAARCRHPAGGAYPCQHCGRWTCLDCHHGDAHLRVCPTTRDKETRRRAR